MNVLCKEAQAAGPRERGGFPSSWEGVFSVMLNRKRGRADNQQGQLLWGCWCSSFNEDPKNKDGGQRRRSPVPIYRKSQRTGFSCSVPISLGPEM